MSNETVTLALDTIRKNKQALIFVPSRASTEKTAEDISSKTKMFLPKLSQQILKAVSSPTKQCRRLSHCVRKGIAFHHAGLVGSQKRLIEEEFKKGNIKIICCTPTLAFGVDLPAFRVIIKSLKRYSGHRGMDWIPVLEYQQMSGRAGRPKYEAFGESISIAKNEREKNKIYERYVCGQPEDIYSKLAVEPVFRTYLLSLVATGIVNSEKSIVDFFSKTFWAFQFKDTNKLKSIIDNMLNLLEEYEFLKIHNSGESSGFAFADELDKKKEVVIKATLLGQRVSELYLDPFTAHHLICCLRNCNEEITAFSFLQMISNTLEMFPLLRVKVKEHEEIQERLVQKYDELLETEPTLYDPNYDDFINSIKTALFFESWIDEREEDFLLEEYGVRPGEIRTKLEIANWLLYSTAELAKLLQFQSLLKEINKLKIRVKYGVKEELLPLLKLKGVGRKRARKLYGNKIKNIKDLNNTSLALLAKLVGQKTAEAIKEQLGAGEKPVSKGKRKGQLSLKKY
jgi:helicase